ncbi:hypothetical protein [Kitasatospora sp. McL0602]|uniref:hypothetical protein n=1 Tax=Kitasatospora sp. McL0602 TaxID=3439530 RepID=UPI003F8C7CD3
MRYTVTSPHVGFTGDVVGVPFAGGTGTVDTDADGGQAAYAYFQRADYALTPIEHAEPDGQEPEQAPAAALTPEIDPVHTFTDTPEADPDLTTLTEGEGL